MSPTTVFRILHLSDTHASATGRDSNGVETLEGLRRLLDACRPDRLDLVVVTGDITDDGSVDGAVAVRDIVRAFATAHGAAAVFLPGNEDTPGSFAQVFGTGHFDAYGASSGVTSSEDGECAAVSNLDGLRVVSLDSTVPGSMFGRVSAGQLAWLASVLANRAPRGTVVALHHPPLVVPDSGFLSSVGLRNRDELASVLADRGVRAILCGHFHAQVSGVLGSIPVWVTPGVASQIDLAAPKDTLRFLSGAGASIVCLSPNDVTFHVIHDEGLQRGRVLREVDLRA